MFNAGDKVRLGKGKTVWTVVSFNGVAAEITNGKQTMYRHHAKLTLAG